MPTASDGNVATFDSLSPNCTVNASNRVCNALDFTGYTNTITFTFRILVSGNVTLGSGMLFSGTGVLGIVAAGTWTSNGVTCPQPLQIGNAVGVTVTTVGTVSGSSTVELYGTITLGGDINAAGLLTMGFSTGTHTFNGAYNINASAGITHGGSTSIINGTATLRAVGTGTYTNPTSSGAMRLNFVINTAGTLTISSTNSFRYNTGTLTYTAGTVVTTSSTLFQEGGTTVLDTNGISWSAVKITFTSATTLSSNLTCTGLLTLGSTTSAMSINGSQINASGGVTHSGSTSRISGTAVLVVTGGAFTGPTSTGDITLPVTFAASTITPTTNAPRIAALTLSGSITFAGSVGIDVDTLTSTVASLTHTLVAGVTYRVRTSLTLRGSSGANTSLVSATPSSAAFFTLDNAANQSVRYVTATDIDSSGGEPIHDYRGTLLRTVNWDVQEAAGVQRGLSSSLSRLRPYPGL